MRLFQRLFWIMIPFFGLIFILGNSNTAEAKKYCSLKNIGLSGCTTDNVDYGIISIRGNTVKYVKYKIGANGYKWEKAGGIKTAKLTSATKYYIGDASKVSASLRKTVNGNKNQINRNNKKSQKKSSKRTYIAKKNIDTEKWVYRVQKGTLKKYISGRNNEIRVARGKVTKIAVRLYY